MIRRVLALVPELPRVRLSSLDPVEIDEDLWQLIATEKRFMPHLHLSVQAGDDMTLKRMKRRHLRQDVIEVCKKARDLRPDIVFGADIIAGFPTETDDMFANTMDIIRQCDLTFLHIFPYSVREGTPAARMPQVDIQIRKDRARQLRTLGDVQVQQFKSRQIGRTTTAIIEQNGLGRTEHFAEVALGQVCEPGSLVTIRIEGEDSGLLKGTILR